MNSVSNFLDQKFKRGQRVLLAKLIEPIKHGSTIASGTLVLMASGDRKLRLRILDRDVPHKGFSEPLSLNSFAQEHRVTPNYLLWYLSQEPIRDFLLEHTAGSVILRVPRKVIHSLPVPLPSRVQNIKEAAELVLTKKDDPFSRLIDEFYRDYILNFKDSRFRTAVILAGAICEVILYQLLLESDVSPQILSGDKTLGLGKMLNYIRLLKLDKAEGFPLTHLMEVQKNRNAAVHVGLQIGSSREFGKRDLDCFDHIIRYFGI